MDANYKGVGFSKGELRLLRQFGSKDLTNREFFGVHVEVTSERVVARATNGRTMAVEIDGISDGKHRAGEWFVSMKFLIDGRKQLEGKELLRLEFEGASLREALIEQAGVVRCRHMSENDAAVLDVTLPGIAKKLKKPAPRRERVHCMALSPGYLQATALAAEAAEEGQLVEIFPPSDADGFVVFQVDADKNTSIIGQVLANVTAEGLSVDDDEDNEGDGEEGEKPKGKRGKKANGKQAGLYAVDGETAS